MTALRNPKLTRTRRLAVTPPGEVDPLGCLLRPQHTLASGAGKKLWALADAIRGVEGEVPIRITEDPRFVQRVNSLVNHVREGTTRDTESPFRKVAFVHPGSVAGFRLITEVLGNGLATGLLVRTGLDLGLARSVVAEASGDSRWSERMAMAEADWEWPGRPYLHPPKSKGRHSIYEATLGGAEGKHIRAHAGLDDVTIAMPSSLLGHLWGVSASFEEGVEPFGSPSEPLAGKMVRSESWGSEAEIVLNPKTSAPQRTLAILLAAWYYSKLGQLDIGMQFRLRESDLVVDMDNSVPRDSTEEVLSVLQAAADWMVLPLERTILELRMRKNRPEDPLADMALSLRLPYPLVCRNARRVYKMIQDQVPI